MLALRRVVGKGRPFGALTDPGSFWGEGEEEGRRKMEEEEGRRKGGGGLKYMYTSSRNYMWVLGSDMKRGQEGLGGRGQEGLGKSTYRCRSGEENTLCPHLTQSEHFVSHHLVCMYAEIRGQLVCMQRYEDAGMYAEI